jgi:predicted lipoprotein with Yx(FWY)xxD motif
MRVLFAVIAVCLLALTGCGGSDTQSEDIPAGEETAAEAPPTEEPTEEPAETTDEATEEETGEAGGGTVGTPLGVTETDLGEIVVDAEGMVVYYFTKDEPDSGVSACEGGCLEAWPPVLTDSETPEAEGVTGELGTIETPDGEMQVTINGMPIYYFAEDEAPGDTNGQGVNEVWYVVGPDGEMIQ